MERAAYGNTARCLRCQRWVFSDNKSNHNLTARLPSYIALKSPLYLPLNTWRKTTNEIMANEREQEGERENENFVAPVCSLPVGEGGPVLKCVGGCNKGLFCRERLMTLRVNQGLARRR